jgi:Family of unknown function (DUF6768)
MDDFDEKIRKGLRSSEGEYDEAKEGMLKEVLFSSFSGRMRSASVVAWCTMLLFAAAAVFCGAKVQLVERTGEMVLYAAFLVIAVNSIMVIKLWYWMLANRNAVQRDVKRLEILVSDALESPRS